MPPRSPYDVFISFKHSAKGGGTTPDATAARRVYEALTAAGISTFYSIESLKHDGTSRFGKAIESALDSAKILVLVASCREHIDSKWVEAEWDTFINDVRSGHKPAGDLIILNCGDLQPARLPLFLRPHSMFSEAEIDSLVRLVKSSLPTALGLGDVIKASLHCANRKDKKDKIYIVTAHAPAGTQHVIKVHWGPRLAKRLASMVRSTGLCSPKEIQEAVAKIAAEKVNGREGYVRKAWRQLLTPEAMRALAAELAVDLPSQAAQPKRASNSTRSVASSKGRRRAGTKLAKTQRSRDSASSARSSH